MTTFVDHQHPRTGDGRFTAKDHPEAELELATPVITFSAATGDWSILSAHREDREVLLVRAPDWDAEQLEQWVTDWLKARISELG